MDLKGYYKNHYVEIDDIFRKAAEVEFSMSGIIKDISILK